MNPTQRSLLLILAALAALTLGPLAFGALADTAAAGTGRIGSLIASVGGWAMDGVGSVPAWAWWTALGIASVVACPLRCAKGAAWGWGKCRTSRCAR